MPFKKKFTVSLEEAMGSVRFNRGDGHQVEVDDERWHVWAGEIISFNEVARASDSDAHDYALRINAHVRNQQTELQKHKPNLPPGNVRDSAPLTMIFTERRLIHPDTTFGQALLRARVHDPNAAVFAQGYLHRIVGLPVEISNQGDRITIQPSALRGFLLAELMVQGIFGQRDYYDQAMKNIVDSVARSESTLGSVRSELAKIPQSLATIVQVRKEQTDRFDALFQQVEQSLKQEQSKWLEKAESAEAELKAIREAYATEKATTAAYEFWNNFKRPYHRNRATAFGLLGMAYVSGLAYLGWTAIPVLKTEAKDRVLDTPAWMLAVGGLSVLFIIWIGRILARLLLAHVHLSEDARERATMIRTYVALVREKIMTPDKVDEAHKALFRSASTGLVVGETSPDTPIEVVTKAIGGKS